MSSAVAFASRAPQQPVAEGRWATVRIEAEQGAYIGRLFVPGSVRRALDLIADRNEMFLELHDVSINDSRELEHFVALRKPFIRTVRVLCDPGAGRGAPWVAEASGFAS